jgi:hypothetical protein
VCMCVCVCAHPAALSTTCRPTQRPSRYLPFPFALPLQLLCVIPSGVLQWLAVTAAVFVSSLHLASNISRPLSLESTTPQARQGARILLLLMAGLHLAFALAMKLYFFSFAAAAA